MSFRDDEDAEDVYKKQPQSCPMCKEYAQKVEVAMNKLERAITWSIGTQSKRLIIEALAVLSPKEPT